MRYIGIDYGDKRIGIAVSDARGALAFPRSVVRNTNMNKSAALIAEIADKEQAHTIIVGLPLNSTGQDSEQTHRIRRFADLLRTKTNITVEFENELLTSRLARPEGGKGEPVDASAAALILQSYLDKHID